MSYFTLRPNLDSPRWKKVVDDGLTFHQDVALGNGTQWRIGMFFDAAGFLCVGVQDHGFYSFDSFVHWGYIMEKFPGMLEADARNIADLINAQFGYRDKKEFGRYEDGLCRVEVRR